MEDDVGDFAFQNLKLYNESLFFVLKPFLRVIESDDLSRLEKFKKNLELIIETVNKESTKYDQFKKESGIEWTYSIEITNTQLEIFNLLLSYVEARISEKKT